MPPLVPTTRQFLIRLVLAICQHILEISPPLRLQPHIPIIRSIRDDPVIPRRQDPAKIRAVIVSIDSRVARDTIDQLRRRILLVHIDGIIHAQVCRERIICRIEEFARYGRDEFARRVENARRLELARTRAFSRSRLERHDAVLQCLQRAFGGEQFNLGGYGVVCLEEGVETGHSVEMHLVDRVVDWDEGQLHARGECILHPWECFELFRSPVPGGLELVNAPFISRHAGGIGQVLELPVRRLHGVFVLEVELENNVHAAFVDTLNNVWKRWDRLVADTTAFVAQVQMLDKAFEAAVADAGIVSLARERVVRRFARLFAHVCLTAQARVVDHGEIAVTGEVDVGLDTFNSSLRGAEVRVSRVFGGPVPSA